MLLDEPFAGIDPIAVIDIQKIIEQLKERGIGVIITDHNVRETLAICDRAYIIKDGQIIRRRHAAGDRRRPDGPRDLPRRELPARVGADGDRAQAAAQAHQQLVMTPQLQQAIKLLQLSRLELVDLVQQELRRTRSSRRPSRSRTTCRAEIRDDAHVRRRSEAPGAAGGAASPPRRSREATDAEKLADVDWQQLRRRLSAARHRREAFATTTSGRSLEATLTRRPSLAEHLDWQLQLASCTRRGARSPRAGSSATSTSTATCARASRRSRARRGVPEAIVERALAKVQEFDPPASPRATCASACCSSCDVLAHRRPARARDRRRPPRRCSRSATSAKLARALGATIEEVAAAARRRSARLEPRPGRAFGGDDPSTSFPTSTSTRSATSSTSC